MALTIKMRIDEQPEHSYIFSTDGGQIELIPLSVIQNGNYASPEGKAYNLVSVNVPVPMIESLNITANGTYEAEDGHAYDVVTVNVQPLLELVTRSITENGTYTIEASEGYDGIEKATVTVNVSGGAPVLIEKNINANGTYNASSDNADGYSKVVANVPNTYSSSDEGKVVNNGALVAQTSRNITQNGTYDTTLNDEVVVNVSGSAPVLIEKNITANGTYNASSDNADGYSKVVVNVSGGGNQDVVEGTFTAGQVTNEYEVTIPYTGNKTLHKLIVAPTEGFEPYVGNSVYPQGTILNLVMIKYNNVTPTYGEASNANRGILYRTYKSSGTAIQSNASNNVSVMYHRSMANATNSATVAQMHIRSNTKFSVATKESTGGTSVYALDSSIEYKYTAVYE